MHSYMTRQRDCALCKLGHPTHHVHPASNAGEREQENIAIPSALYTSNLSPLALRHFSINPQSDLIFLVGRSPDHERVLEHLILIGIFYPNVFPTVLIGSNSPAYCERFILIGVLKSWNHITVGPPDSQTSFLAPSATFSWVRRLRNSIIPSNGIGPWPAPTPPSSFVPSRDP